MATYYVRASGGSDGNDGLSFANGWATVQYGIDTIGVGDTLLICADGTHYPTAALDLDNTASTSTNPFVIKGASALGSDDGTMAIISGTSLPASTVLVNVAAAEYYVVKNLRFTAATSIGIAVGTSYSASILFLNCRIDNNSSHGVQNLSISTNKSVKLLGCEVDHNGGTGITNANNSDRNISAIINCSVHDNVNYGIILYSTICPLIISGSLIYRNTGAGFLSSGSQTGLTVNNNVFFANTLHGIHISNSTFRGVDIFNNIFRSNGGYGINLSLVSINQVNLFDYNCSHNNTSGHTNVNGGVLPGSSNILQDPLFVSETIGSEDFTLQSSSPCLNVGLGYNGV